VYVHAVPSLPFGNAGFERSSINVFIWLKMERLFDLRSSLI
jgi:hypothetical protein